MMIGSPLSRAISLNVGCPHAVSGQQRREHLPCKIRHRRAQRRSGACSKPARSTLHPWPSRRSCSCDILVLVLSTGARKHAPSSKRREDTAGGQLGWPHHTVCGDSGFIPLYSIIVAARSAMRQHPMRTADAVTIGARHAQIIIVSVFEKYAAPGCDLLFWS